MSADADFLTSFESQTLPLEQFHHREHVRLAYLCLLGSSFDDAAARIRKSIKAYGAAKKIEVSPTSGYHETMTMAWLTLVGAILSEYGPEESSEAFCGAHPELMQKKTLRLFYSKERFMSAEAKASFIEPDLAPLPRSRRDRRA